LLKKFSPLHEVQGFTSATLSRGPIYFAQLNDLFQNSLDHDICV